MLQAYGQVFQSVCISNSATEGYSILYKKKKIDGLRLRDKFLPKILFEMSCSAIISFEKQYVQGICASISRNKCISSQD